MGHTHFVLSLFQAEVRGFPGDSQIAASTSPGQWERHRRGSKLTVMGGCKNSPPWGKRKQGCPLVSPASRGPPRHGGAAGGDADKAQSGVPAGAAGPGGGRGGGQSAVVAVAVPKRPRPRWPCSSGGSSWP